MRTARKLLRIAIAVASAAVFLSAQQPASGQQTSAHTPVLASTPLQVNRLDPSADHIVPANATLEKIATGFTWIEGPVWLNNSLYFAEITSNSIRRWTPDGRVTIVLQPSGYKGSDHFNGREPGSNGMTLDLNGRLTVAGHAQRDVYRFDSLTPNARTTILADEYQGKRLNSPNDLVYRADGSLYFTDPPYGLETQKDTDPKKQLTTNGVYRIPRANAQRPGAAPARDALQLVIKDLPRPNGITFSPDGKFLYVDNSEPKRLWMRYCVQPDGTLTDPHLLYDASSDTRPGAPDGMKVDRQGNIYSAGPGGVSISRQTENSSSQSQCPNGSPTWPGVTPIAKPSTSLPAPACTASTSKSRGAPMPRAH